MTAVICDLFNDYKLQEPSQCVFVFTHIIYLIITRWLNVDWIYDIILLKTFNHTNPSFYILIDKSKIHLCKSNSIEPHSTYTTCTHPPIYTHIDSTHYNAQNSLLLEIATSLTGKSFSGFNCVRRLYVLCEILNKNREDKTNRAQIGYRRLSTVCEIMKKKRSSLKIEYSGPSRSRTLCLMHN